MPSRFLWARGKAVPSLPIAASGSRVIKGLLLLPRKSPLCTQGQSGSLFFDGSSKQQGFLMTLKMRGATATKCEAATVLPPVQRKHIGDSLTLTVGGKWQAAQTPHRLLH